MVGQFGKAVGQNGKMVGQFEKAVGQNGKMVGQNGKMVGQNGNSVVAHGATFEDLGIGGRPSWEIRSGLLGAAAALGTLKIAVDLAGISGRAA